MKERLSYAEVMSRVPQPVREFFLEASARSPVVYRYLQELNRGSVSYVEMLEGMVMALEGNNMRMVAMLSEVAMKHAMPTVIPLQEGAERRLAKAVNSPHNHPLR